LYCRYQPGNNRHRRASDASVDGGGRDTAFPFDSKKGLLDVGR
jgi:hypothetical protein